MDRRPKAQNTHFGGTGIIYFSKKVIAKTKNNFRQFRCSSNRITKCTAKLTTHNDLFLKKAYYYVTSHNHDKPLQLPARLTTHNDLSLLKAYFTKHNHDQPSQLPCSHSQSSSQPLLEDEQIPVPCHVQNPSVLTYLELS